MNAFQQFRRSALLKRWTEPLFHTTDLSMEDFRMRYFLVFFFFGFFFDFIFWFLFLFFVGKIQWPNSDYMKNTWNLQWHKQNISISFWNCFFLLFCLFWITKVRKYIWPNLNGMQNEQDCFRLNTTIQNLFMKMQNTNIS